MDPPVVEAESADQVGFLARAVCRPGQPAVGDQEVEDGEVAALMAQGQVGGADSQSPVSESARTPSP